jgi:WD40 repeat protein
MSTERRFVPRDTGAVDADQPWPGLSSFQENDRAFFRGREAEVEELHRLVQREGLTIFFGHSGLGKTSLLQAGLFPRLREEGALPVYIRLDHTGGSVPLREQVKSAILAQAKAADVEAAVPQDAETLWEFFHRQESAFWSSRNRLVLPTLVFDQFEEIFTVGRDTPERATASAELLAELGDLIEGRPPASIAVRLEQAPSEVPRYAFGRHHYKVVLSLREDFLAELEALRDRIPSISHNRMRLGRMTGQQAKEVVGQTDGRLVDAEAVEPIVRFVAGATAEGKPLHDVTVDPALLSVFCRELNTKRIHLGQARITAALLEGSWAEILRDFYERSLADLSPEVRTFVEEDLLTISGFRDSVALENALTRPGVTVEAIRLLVDRRFLRLDDTAGLRRLELAHDVLTDVVRSSRDTRREREERARADAARVAAEERERRTRAELRRSRRASMVLLVLVVLAIAGATWGFISQSRASRALTSANEALAEAHFSAALNLIQSDQAHGALAHLARAARLDSHSVATRALMFDALLARSWPLPVASLGRRFIKFAEFSPDGERILVIGGLGSSALVIDASTRRSMIELSGTGIGFDGAAFSPNGRLIATIEHPVTVEPGKVVIWDAHTGQAVDTLDRGRFTAAAFSPDGRRLVTASRAGRHEELGIARVWDIESGNLISTCSGHRAAINTVHFSPDGRLLVTTSQDSTARVWDARTGTPLGEPMRHSRTVRNPGPRRGVSSAYFSADGRRVVTASSDGTARVWDALSGSPLTEPMRHSDVVVRATFSPDSRRVLTASFDSTARIWDARTGEPLGEAMRHPSYLNDARFSPDGERVITASDDYTARIWDAQTGHALSEPLRHIGPVRLAAFAPVGQRVVTADDHLLRIWQVAGSAGRHLSQPLVHQWPPSAIAFSPDGQSLITLTGSTSAQIWDISSGRPIGEPLQHSHCVNSVEFSPNGERIITASADGGARIWDARLGQAIGKPIWHRPPGDSGDVAIGGASFGPDGNSVLTYARRGVVSPFEQLLRRRQCPRPVAPSVMDPSHRISPLIVRVWDVRTGQPVGKYLHHESFVWFATFSPDGRRIVTTSDDATARIWDARTGDPIGKAMDHGWAVVSAAFSSDSKRFVTVADGWAWILDAATGDTVARVRHADWVVSAMFSPDGQRIVTASRDHTARLWNANTGEPVGEPMRHYEDVTTAVFSPDGKRLITASDDGSARVWDGRSGRPLSDPLRHRREVAAALFSPDGRRMLTASDDSASGHYAVRLWDVPVGTERDASALARLAESIAGFQLGETGALVPLADPAAVRDSLRYAFATAADGDGSTASLIKWILADHATRTISPFSRITVPEYIRRRVTEEGQSACGQIRRDFPGHPALREHCR